MNGAEALNPAKDNDAFCPRCRPFGLTIQLLLVIDYNNSESGHKVTV